LRPRFLFVGVLSAGAILLALPSAVVGAPTLPRLDVPRDLKVVSYFRTDAGWTEMWTDWQPDKIDADLTRAASLNANTVRVIVQPDLFGYPHPAAKYRARLAEFISLAAAHGLHVQLTLFDWWYGWEDVDGSKTWATELLAPYVEDPRIAFVELRNEILPNQATLPWASVMIPFLQGFLRDIPVTISVAGPDPPSRLRVLANGLGHIQPDFWDIHDFSGDGGVTYDLIRRAQRIARTTPVWIGEAGYPTTTIVSGCGGVPLTPSAQEAAQQHFFSVVSWATRATGSPDAGVWVLDDMVPKAVPDRPVVDTNPELHFGLFRLDGSAKPAADTVRAVFSGAEPDVFNAGFEDAVTSASGTAVPAEWSLTGNADFAQDTSVAAEGKASVRITPRHASRAASVSIVPPPAAVSGGTHVTVGALARRAAPGGSVFVVVEWMSREHRVVGRSASKPSTAAVGKWGELRLSSTAPRDAVYGRIDLVVRGATSPVWFDRVSFSR
jgi:hypothetical protein